MDSQIDDRVLRAVDAWLRWVPTWKPGSHTGRSRMCRKCTGSPLLLAAGISGTVPHQVAHALTSRMQRIIDRMVDEYTSEHLPALQAELAGEEIWNAGGYEPGAGLAPEYDGIDLDPEADPEQPFLFTFAVLAEASKPPPALPRPPLSSAEKVELRTEIELADQYAQDVGQQLCFALTMHKVRVLAAIEHFVEPQIQALLEELSSNLEPPR